MAFQDQVEDLTSLSVSDTGELSQFLKDGVIDVTNRWLLIKPQDATQFQRESSISDSQGLSVGGAKILGVIREAGADGSSDGSTAWEVCREIPASMQSRAVDLDSLFYASKYNPVFTMNSDKTINVYPTPSSNNGFKVFYVNEEPRDITNNAALIHSHSDIKYFPNDKVYLVVMYAGIRLLQATMGSNVISLTSVPPDVPSLATVSFSESNSLSISATDPTAITLTTVNYSAVSATASTALSSLTAPTYAKPYLDDIADSTAISGGSDNTTKLHRFSEEFTSIGDLSITAVPPDVPTISTISYTSATETDIGSVSDVTVTAITFPTADIPTYDKTSLQTAREAFNDYWVIGDFPDSDPGELSITAVPPDSPTIATISYSAASATGVTDSSALVSEQSTVDVSGNAPTYTPPKVGGATEELTATMTALGSDALATDADFLDFSDWFTALGEMIEDEEDTELAQAQIGKISTYIQAYGQAMQNQVHEFNEGNVRYQMEFQEAVTKENQDLQVAIANANNLAQEYKQESQQETQVALQNAAKAMEDDIADNNSKVQKYQAELGVYQAEVGAQVQEYTQKLQRYSTELGIVHQAWAKTESDSLQEYQLDIQANLNEFNEDNVIYQSTVQKAIQNATIAAQEAQKEGDLTLQAAIQDYTLELQKYQSEVAQYQAEINSEIQEANAKIQQYQLLYNQLKAEYDQAFMIAAPKQQPQQQVRA